MTTYADAKNMTPSDLAAELDADEADVRVLVDQLISLDGHDAVMIDDRITADAADIIRDQIASTACL